VTLAERVRRTILATNPSTLSGRATLKTAISVERLLVRLGDPVVRYRIGDVELELPLSHRLPYYRHDHPEYDRPLARIARALSGPVVDVGANVGDTAAAIRGETRVPILCVEGEGRFLRLLERNAKRLGDVEIEPAFVESPAFGRVVRSHGTARIVEGSDFLPTKSLADILASHPRFERPSLVKLDTDGMDVPILLANMELLRELRPVVFFEYDPHLGAQPEIFDELRDAGYEWMLAFENTGELAHDGPLDPSMHDAYVGHEGRRYADICVGTTQTGDVVRVAVRNA
jgi:FkbM family methyltransferase